MKRGSQQKIYERQERTMGLTDTASILEFFSNNSEFYPMSINGVNCFLHALSLITFFKKIKKLFKRKYWLNHTIYLIQYLISMAYRIDILETSDFFSKQYRQ